MSKYSLRAKDILLKIAEKGPYAVECAHSIEGIPYTVKNGCWAPGYGIDWWTNGFWPAEMWQMYLETGNALYRDEALRGEELLDEALKNFETLHHDVGFMWLISSGVHYALEKDEASRKRLVLAGDLLASRYNPNGFIRAWNDGPENRSGWSIIDTMMNLPLLYAMSRLTSDPRFRLMAISHARTAANNFFKPDGSVYHIIVYDPENGKILETPAGQGCAPGSSWSRGQSWAMYGFTLSFLCTKDEAFLDCARRVSDFFISHLPENRLAPIDFCQPSENKAVDNCANAIAASALIELSRILAATEPDVSARYEDAAADLLFALDETSACYDLSIPALLTRCTGAYGDSSPEYPILYADYFYIEALRKLAGETRLFWTMA